MDVWGLFVWQHLPLSPTVIPAFTRAQHRKKSSSCLIHLLLDTHKIQLKPNNNAPPIPRPPSAAIQVSCWGSGLVDFLNPPLPAWGLGKKREQNQWSAIVQAHSLLAFPPFLSFNPFSHPFSSTYAYKVTGGRNLSQLREARYTLDRLSMWHQVNRETDNHLTPI